MARPRRSNLGRNTANAREIQRRRQSEPEAIRQNRLQVRREQRAVQRARRISDARGLGEDNDHHHDREVLQLRDKTNSAFSYDPRIDYVTWSSIGRMTEVCPHCNALKWKGESAGLCCSSGKVRLPSIQEPPELLRRLLMGEDALSDHFLANTLFFNRAFQMTSMGANVIREGNFMPTFKVQGQVYHLIGSLLPENDSQSKFLQLYFISDYDNQVDSRMNYFPNLDRCLMLDLQGMLHQINPYARDFKAALASLPLQNQENYKLVIDADRKPASHHSGQYNRPTTNEVAVLLVDQQHPKRDIVLRTRSNGLQRISETHRSYDALQYPLMFCHGDDGYNFSVPIFDVQRGEEDFSDKVTALQFYCYRLMVRKDQPNYLHKYRQLLNQFFVDMYAKIETERLSWIRFNQSKLRAEDFIHLQDAILQDGNPEDLGCPVRLPSSFTGGPRYMHARTQDGFCYIREEGRPDLFVTITTNPKWKEITDELDPGQTAADRHDIVTRVFHLKLKKLMDLLVKDKIFGPVKCHMCSVEWQKRGLPHAHILIWLVEKIRPERVDDIISAEIPDPDYDPELHEIIKSHMIHGPCGTLNSQSPCMKDGHCSKRFPKTFLNETITGEDGYPQYRRRSPRMGGTSISLSVRGQRIEVDNRWVVPFSPVLSRIFNAHINVEYCHSVKSIKYICKYVNKGSDLATFGFTNNKDEVAQYQSGRYISTSEAVHRMLSFSIHERSPPVVPLDVHLENGQRVYFDPANVRERIENPRNTTLMAFFQLCRQDDFAKGLLYKETPKYYTFDKTRRVFKRRLRGTPVDDFPGIRKENAIGRVYTVHPNNSECYFLRLLLHTVKGPTSFDALKTVDGVVYPTYQGACKARNLLEDDTHWANTLREACAGDSAAKLRQLFAIMLVFCSLSNPIDLWTEFKESFLEDLLKDLKRRMPDVNLEAHSSYIENCALSKLQDCIFSIGGKSLSDYGLPTPDSFGDHLLNRELSEETNYDPLELDRFITLNEPKLTDEQQGGLADVLDSVDHERGEMFSCDAPGGTGKTFWINVLLSKVRRHGKVALAVASSGIAATLLPGGKTAHSAFKIPINLDASESPMCSIPKNSSKAAILRKCVLIVWDELPMAHKKAVEAFDRTMRDIRGDNRFMGGITILFSGDFRQTLPVIPRGTRADEVNACMKRSYLWSHVKKLSFTKNMRAHLGNDPLAQQFSNTLLKIGEGTIPEIDGEVDLPASLCTIVSSVEELISNVYPEVGQIALKDHSWFCKRAILTPTNDQAAVINNTILGMFEADQMTYTSIDTTVDQDEVTNYPVEFLNSLKVPGLPAHEITLKIGSPIILMRNLCPPKLCNGTRLLVKSLQPNVIEATVLVGCAAGEAVYIPRIPIIPTNFPFQFKRLQFPVSVCFAMTINKSQGQTLQTAGVDLRKTCFSHGQLYVACSRVSAAKNLFILTPGGKTRNVVYKEIL